MAKANPRRANGYRRNQLRRRVLLEESICWLCGLDVDVSLPHGLPSSPEVDEVIPVAMGGDPFDRANCRLAHRACNLARGARLSVPPPPVEGYSSPRTW